MPNFTTNLDLEKPLGTEYYDIEVHNKNSDKIDTFAGEVLKKAGDTADDLKVTAPPIDDLDVTRKQELNSMSGADIKGYIEDGTPHVVGEVWLSKNTPGEFKCLINNSDNFVDLTPGVEKWIQIDDKTNAERLDSLANSYDLTPEYQNSKASGLVLKKMGELILFSFYINANVTVDPNEIFITINADDISRNEPIRIWSDGETAAGIVYQDRNIRNSSSQSWIFLGGAIFISGILFAK